MAKYFGGPLCRAGKTKRQTPVVPKTSEKEQTNKKTRLRKKFNIEVKSRCCNEDVSASAESKISTVGGLTPKEIDRQMFRIEKQMNCEAKYRSWLSDYPTGDTNTKKPHKKERQAIDEFYFQKMFGD